MAPRHVHSVTRIDPGYVTLLVSGMTAAISLDKVMAVEALVIQYITFVRGLGWASGGGSYICMSVR